VGQRRRDQGQRAHRRARVLGSRRSALEPAMRALSVRLQVGDFSPIDSNPGEGP
jgi:hypothetical protein